MNYLLQSLPHTLHSPSHVEALEKLKFVELLRVDAHAFSFDKLGVSKFLLNANAFLWGHMGQGRNKLRFTRAM